MTAREDLHAFIDGLDDDSIETALYILRHAMGDRFLMPEKPVPLEERMKPLSVPGSVFFALSNSADLATVTRMQGVSPVNDLDDLVADFWPEDESVDEFVATIREWRREGGYA